MGVLKRELGQVPTPSEVARLMASMLGPLPRRVRVLDAGAGAGGLTEAFVAEACAHGSRPEAISALAFEIDGELISRLRGTMDACRGMCAKHGIAFQGLVGHEDFLAAGARECDVAILNPPYRKIAASSPERRLLARAGIAATNLYAAFVSLAVRWLAPGGQLVAIVPRSFCNGPYFRSFRALLLGETVLRRIHVFESRREVFKRDGILQESVILHASKGGGRPRQVIVSSSRAGAAGMRERRLALGEVVREAGGDSFIHLPIEESDDAVARYMNGLPHTLASLGITVSTGRVVGFRARELLLARPQGGSAPLIHPCHLVAGEVRWPLADARKPQAIVADERTRALLVPRGWYVVTRRFSSKEERRRLVAAVYDPAMVQAPLVGFENHLNYFHRDGAGLSREEAHGLAAFLNSEAIDRYFRQFNGHTQVNASDLRSLRYPGPSTRP